MWKTIPLTGICVKCIIINHIQFRAELGGHIWTHPACKSLLDVARENETRTYIRPLSEEWLLLGPRWNLRSSPNQVNGLELRPCPSGSEEAGLSHLRHLRRLKHLDEIDPKTRRRGRWKSGKRKGFSKLAKQASFPRPENSASPHSQVVVCTLSRHTVVLPTRYQRPHNAGVLVCDRYASPRCS